MNTNFDNLRRNLAESYNKCVNAVMDESIDQYQERFDDLKSYIGAIMCLYDPDQENDCNDLSDIELDDYTC